MCTYPQVHIWQIQEGSFSVISAIVLLVLGVTQLCVVMVIYRKWLLECWSPLAAGRVARPTHETLIGIYGNKSHDAMQFTCVAKADSAKHTDLHLHDQR